VIFLDEPGRASRIEIADSVAQESCRGFLFHTERQDLAQKGIVRISLSHPRDEAPRCEERKELRRLPRRFAKVA
jgi:hypothetical protein